MSQDIRFFSGKKVRIEPGSMGIYLNVWLPDDTAYTDVEPRRFFPISNEFKYISLVHTVEDAKGKIQEEEILIIKDLANLDEDSRKAVINSLDGYYMIPRITDILEFKKVNDDLQWTVASDRGIITFDIRDKYSSIKQLPDGRILVKDASDNRYEITDYKTISKRSRNLLLGYL